MVDRVVMVVNVLAAVVAVDDIRPGLHDLPITHLDALRQQDVIQEITVLPVGRLGSLHMKCVDRRHRPVLNLVKLRFLKALRGRSK